MHYENKSQSSRRAAIHQSLQNPAPDRMAEMVLVHASERSVLGEVEARGLVPFRLGER
jgi:hypothetical protein